LLWIDGLAAVTAGVVMLAGSRWWSEWYGFPQRFVVFLGMVNLLYACYSLGLAWSAVRPMPLIVLLVVANSAWAIACLGLAGSLVGSAHGWGIGHLIGEGFFVGGLAFLEWRWRKLF
jgi:hypothetical protein